jgi:hypothetical protein
MKMFYVWNYWDHVLVAKCATWAEAQAALDKLRMDKPTIGYDWSGIEAVTI